MIGQTILHYRILDKLGEGGMGVVYKAQDTTLDRLVALKFLPSHVSVNEETKARFLQEARAAAALNHAHICTVHGIEEEGSQVFIVMEYIEGGTLREKLPFSNINDALSIVIQIGEALQEAHAKGIVHRDIKADNIMLTSKGQAKVMDFGLAKLKGSLKLTKSSSTVGTLAYMAPEQFQGGEVDARSDIFSLGVLLFELLTGKTPFRGEHEAAMVYSIVNEEPESILQHRPEISSGIVHILGKALEKDPADRFQSAAEMVVDLRRAIKQSSKISGAAVSGAHHRPIPQPRSMPPPQPSRQKLWFGVGGLAVLIVIAAAYFLLKAGGSTPTARLNPDMTMRVLSIPFTQFSYAGISPDGNWVVFPAPDANNRWDFYYMHVSSADPRRITADSGGVGTDLSADISPDGSQVAYMCYKPNYVHQLCLTSALGGVRKVLADTSSMPRWRPDGERIGYVRFGKKALRILWSVKPDGSDSRLEFADTLTFLGRYSFAWSPDGQSVAWIRTFKEGHQEVITRELATGVEKQLTFDRKNIDDVYWTRKGVIVFSSNKAGNTNLWMVPVSGGTPQQITKGSGPDIGLSMSADGQKLVYLQQQNVGNVWIATTDGSSARQATFDERAIYNASLSPDGKQMALSMADVDPLKPSLHLFVQDRDGANRRQITTGETIAVNPVWSPDGKRIVFTMTSVTDEQGDSATICTVDAANPGMPKPIIAGNWALWLNPETIVVYRQNSPSCEQVTLEGGSHKPFFEDSTTAYPVASGKKIVYWDKRKGKEGWWSIATDNATNAAKSGPKRLFRYNVAGLTKNFLYFWNERGELWRLNCLTETRERLKGPFPGLEAPAQFSVRDDDKEFLYIPLKLSGKLVLIENLFQ